MHIPQFQFLYSFVNSQEWTIPRTVPEIKLGILGSVTSGKSALVHRYLTGSFLQEDSPEGGRFKKEVTIDGRSYLLLIRDEGGPPEAQFANWVDAVIFVFSVEDLHSFDDVYSFYAKMAGLRASGMDVPVIVVGTQDAISKQRPRVIGEDVTMRITSDFRGNYHETCATYGLNVERVFQEACKRVVQNRQLNHNAAGGLIRPSNGIVPPVTPSYRALGSKIGFPELLGTSLSNGNVHRPHQHHQQESLHGQSSNGSQPLSYQASNHSAHSSGVGSWNRSSDGPSPRGPLPPVPLSGKDSLDRISSRESAGSASTPLATPATPNTIRKNRRRSNILMSRKTDDEKKQKDRGEKGKDDGPLGHGRPIPKKQGFLHKRSTRALQGESRKKKYCVLFDGGRLVYYTSMDDYMNKSGSGKEISLAKTTVRVPGKCPTGVQRPVEQTPQKSQNGTDHNGRPENSPGEGVLLTAYEILSEVAEYPPPRTPCGSVSSACDEAVIIGNGSMIPLTPTANGGGTPGLKKRQKKLKSLKLTDSGDGDSDFEFVIHSLDNDRWCFDASSAPERDEWVRAIEEEIHNSFSQQTSQPQAAKHGTQAVVDKTKVMLCVAGVPGNDRCADCQAPRPVWASLNLGVAICIDCSGIHRQLGTHVSRVRSLDLDVWTSSLLDVMKSTGNRFASAIWEATLPHHRRLAGNCTREERERFIRAKYVSKEYLAALPSSDPAADTLVDAVFSDDLPLTVLCLAHLSKDEVNRPLSPHDRRTPLHVACDHGNVVITQLLLWSEANPNLRDGEGLVPLYYAQQAKSSECYDILLQNGALALGRGCGGEYINGAFSESSSLAGSGRKQNSSSSYTTNSERSPPKDFGDFDRFLAFAHSPRTGSTSSIQQCRTFTMTPLPGKRKPATDHDGSINQALHNSGMFFQNGAYNGLVHSESTVTVENFWKSRDRLAAATRDTRPRASGSDASESSGATDELPPSTDPWALPELRQIDEEETKWRDLSALKKLTRIIVHWIGQPVLVLALLYFFICSLDFLSSAFQLLGGRAAGKVFVENPFLSNPICGLMIGLLSTVMVQSSSTSTSITVTMVASGILDVRTAIPIIMGANIGTSITNTIVSLAHTAHKDEFRRAFAGATVHDMFNWLCVIVLLPLEVGTGYLYTMSGAVVKAFNIPAGGAKGEETEFLKHLTEPFTSRIIQLDKEIIGQIAIGNNASYLETASLRKKYCAYADVRDASGNGTTRNGTEICYFLFNSEVLSDWMAGVILLACSLVMLCCCLVFMVKILNAMLRGSIAQSIRKFINSDFPGCFRHLTGYAAILVGAGLTIVVQSSSVFTSALTPLVGIGVVSLERMYPLTLGSNLGTTGTGILAAFASGGGKQLEAALQIAFCHLFFNISGILLFYPIPLTRIPIQMARIMGNTTAQYRWFALLYLVTMYFALPAFVFLLSMHAVAMYCVGVPLAVLLVLVVVVNFMQRKCARFLPDALKDWKKLPIWLRSLEPYDQVFRKLNCLSCCKTCCGDPDDGGQGAIQSAATKLSNIRGLEDSRLYNASDAESRRILLDQSRGNSAAPSRVTSSAHLSQFFVEREQPPQRENQPRKLTPPSSTSVV
ncbi:Arf-GAP with GTPase, ANK repeat and PH domain-containing protein 3 [Hypsibius exemplaris]|uniref:Arf-GAP with GTPase, ANK repeat and PH domain-containing protein 3 n=1 Tax=Hypsibius exemplaris TaxID=2072580 RepID=A0A1W0WUK3_HYPEX|nr:Arf-GAP with GTPase, ANK repeat and PH domain-containing protein 3 [Hypsibius exemplaris]